MDYADLNIWLGGQGDRLLVQVLPSDWVYGMWQPVNVPFGGAQVVEQARMFRRGALRDNERRSLGTALYDMLLPVGPVRDLYQDSRVLALREGRGLRLRLHISTAGLDDLPWEFAYGDDEKGYLVLDPRFSITRVPHLSGAKVSIRPVVKAFPLRIVGAFPSPRDLPDLDTEGEQEILDKVLESFNVEKERQAVERVVDELPDDVQVESVWLPGTRLEDLLQHVPDAHVLHFGGHGMVGEPGSGEPAYLALEDQEGLFSRLPASTLALILRRSRVRVAIFLACETARQSPETGESMPQFLIDAGLSAVIAMQAPITDIASQLFGRHFYEALAAGLPVDAALSAARFGMRVRAPRGWADWAVPVLYLAPDSRGLIFPERTLAPELEAARQRQPIMYVVQQFGTVSGGQISALTGDLANLLDQAPSSVPKTLVRQTAAGIPDADERPSPATGEERRSMTQAKPLVYKDLVLEVSGYQADGRFQVRILDSPVDGMTQAEAEESRLDADAVSEESEIKKSLAELLRRLGGRDASQAEMIEIGARLAGLLLPGRVGEIYRQSRASLQEGQGLRLRLRIEPQELANLPWELLYVQTAPGERNPNDLLAWQRRVSVTRYETIGKADKTQDPSRTIRLAMVLSSPEGPPRLDLEKEELAILGAIETVNEKGQVIEVKRLGSQIEDTPDATRQNLVAVVKGADVFHFAGHGRFEEGKEGEILLRDADGYPDGFKASKLANLLGSANARLAVLGACDGGRRDGLNHWTGIAPALVRERVPAVVAMQDTVRDRNAAVFDAVLYARLLAGYTIDEAVFEGRQAILTNARSQKERDWAMPVLYLRDEDGILFPVPEEPAGSDQPVLRIRQELQTVEGKVLGLRARQFVSGEVDIWQKITTVKDGGEVVGADLGSLGWP